MTEFPGRTLVVSALSRAQGLLPSHARSAVSMRASTIMRDTVVRSALSCAQHHRRTLRPCRVGMAWFVVGEVYCDRETAKNLSRQRILCSDRTLLSRACLGQVHAQGVLPHASMHPTLCCDQLCRNSEVLCRERTSLHRANSYRDTTLSVATRDQKSLSRQRILCHDKNPKMGSSPPFYFNALHSLFLPLNIFYKQ